MSDHQVDPPADGRAEIRRRVRARVFLAPGDTTDSAEDMRAARLIDSQLADENATRRGPQGLDRDASNARSEALLAMLGLATDSALVADDGPELERP